MVLGIGVFFDSDDTYDPLGPRLRSLWQKARAGHFFGRHVDVMCTVWYKSKNLADDIVSFHGRYILRNNSVSFEHINHISTLASYHLLGPSEHQFPKIVLQRHRPELSAILHFQTTSVYF